MKKLNSYGTASRLGIQVLCVNLLLSLSPSASAQATPLHTSFSPVRFLHSLSPASHPWGPMHLVSSVATDVSIVDVDDETAMTPGKETGGMIESTRSAYDSSCLDATLRAEGLPSVGTGGRDDESKTEPTGLLDMFSSGGDMCASTPAVISSSGAIEANVDSFRALLGGPNNNATPGEQPAGRREINWDAVPASLTNVANFPNNFFNTNSPRGLVYDRTSRGLEVSDRSFIDVNPDYAGEFLPFSAPKLFSPMGRNESNVRFFVAGSDTKAAVSGFGVVFVDVDRAGSATIELLGVQGLKLGTFSAPVRSDRRGVSFIGVVFRNPVISSVRIISGDGRLAAGELDISHGGQHDLVVMDNFIYGEPKATGN